MLTGIPALEQTDWAKLYHAYGSAADTPKHLRALLDEDAGGREAALDHLWSAVIHQGTPWTVTGPAACVIVGLLADERIDRGEMPLRAPLLQFLVSVAEAGEQTGRSVEELERMAVYNSDPVKTWDEAFENDDDAACNAFYARSILGCMEVAPLLLETMEHDLRSPDPRVRSYAAMGASTLAKASSLSGRAKDIEQLLRNMAQTAEDTDERSALVLALGELDTSPSGFLRDPSPAVRMCAALAPKLAEDAVATEVLIKSLEKAGEIDTWFAATPPQIRFHPRFAVVERAIERVKEFERLINGAEEVIRVTTLYCADFDWGPLLAAAFPDGRGVAETPAQRRFLKALVANEALWDPKFGNADRWFKKAGLPHDRDQCAKRADGR